MAIYSTQFWNVTLDGSTIPAPIYTVPTNAVIVLRSFDALTTAAGVPPSWAAIVGSAGSPLALCSIPIDTAAATGASQWRGYAVFNAGEELVVTWGPAGTLYTQGAGYLFVITPP